jgi:hypothetical protein
MLFSWCCLLLAAAAARAGELKHVTLLVDCSRHMDQPLQEGSRTTRYEAATKATLDVLAKLAEKRDYSVTLTLFGERIVATRESQPLTKQDLAGYRDTLTSTTPAGSASVVAALQDAVKAIPAEMEGTTKIILLTSSASDVRASSAAKEEVIDALKAAHAEAQIVQVAAEEPSADLQEIADATSGTMLFADSVANVQKAARVAAGYEQKPVPREVKVVNNQEPPVLEPPPPGEVVEAPAADDKAEANVVVDVTYHGTAVADAKIYLRGENFDLVYDRVAERTSRQLRLARLKGTYIFADVPFGVYTMEISANVKNRKFVVFREIAVERINKSVNPVRTFKIQLEKVKDPLFRAAAPAAPPPAP